ncbi:MAG TPA: 23S rRNA (guanosine(2251)-2'-O)-methyltransferase RlmB [Eubacteriales bacterium]|nr:23S rRNA (guanosine(2251)-2'-O)-methyltransferase RlmB [Eubacteriales bacterium]
MAQKQYGSSRSGRDNASSSGRQSGGQYRSNSGYSGESKSGYQGKKTYSSRPEGGYKKKSYGDGHSGYEKKSYGNSRDGYEKKSYGSSRDGYEKRSYGEHTENGDRKKPYGRPQGGYRKHTDDRAEFSRANPREETGEAVREPDELPFLILGRNAVKEAIKSGRSIDRIEVLREPDGSLREILSLAKDRALVIREVDKHRLDEICMPFGHGGKPGNHQGIVAYAAGVEYCTVKDILAVARERKEAPFVIVLDGILDPHNLGSIIRSAECAGAHGVIIGKRRSASVTAATVKASAGATEHVKIARVVNIGAAIDELKRAKLWVAGADMAGQSMDQQGLNGPLALVIGGEGSGLSRLVSEKCDFLVSIPQHGKIGSLNAGVAAGILMFEKKRQDAQE